MNALILGGTRFIGRHIAESLVSAGHAVTTFTRGKSQDSLPSAVTRLKGDRDDGKQGHASLGDRTWDVCIDVSGYTPRQVRASVEHLHDRIGHYVFISTVSVYVDSGERPVTEAQPRFEPADECVTEINTETYGPLKVTCENIVQQGFPRSSTILRPQIVAGPHDHTGRYPFWVLRAAQCGPQDPMLGPGDGSDHVQVIDARDLARFTRSVVEHRTTGVFNLAGPRLTWADFVRVLGAKSVVWVPAHLLAGMDFNTLPLYRPEHGERAAFMDVCNAKALAAGLTLTDPITTARDTLHWIRKDRPDRLETALTPQLERELIRAAQTR